MKHPKRGEIYWVELDPTIGSEINKRRPAVVLSLDVFNARRDTVVMIPLSSKGTPRPPLVVSVPSARIGTITALFYGWRGRRG